MTMTTSSFVPRSSGRQLSHAVVNAVATAEERDPTTLPPLYNAIDPDALDALFADRGDQLGRIAFRYHGYDVAVSENGHVVLDSIEGK